MNWTNKNIRFIKLFLRISFFTLIFSFVFFGFKNIVLAADTQVDIADTALSGKDALAGPYWIDTNEAAIIFINSSQDMSYASTTDAGVNWNSEVIVAGTAKHAASWFDQETPGDTGTLVHTAWVDVASSSLFYNTVDIDDGTIGTLRTVDSGITVADSTLHRIALTKTVGGNLLLCFSTLSEVGCYRSVDNGANWTARADLYETGSESDWALIFPANTADDNDIAAVFWDRDANELSLKMYDDSANSWTETSIDSSMSDGIVMNMDASVRHSDSHILLVAWSAYDTPAADLLSWDLTVDSIALPTITSKTSLLTDQIDAAQAAIVINQQNDDVYLGYMIGTAWAATVDVVYKKSTDGMDTWGTQTSYSETLADDFRTIDGGRTIDNDGGYIQFSFFNDDPNDISVNLNNDIAIAAVLNVSPNAPTLVSPSNASYVADDTPTLSANYSDNDSGDTGTTNYRISSSSLADCTSNINIVASGTSSETSTNNENTTYAPGFSIGSDGTYYWCAQNNDGLATSSWTQMGSFVLDTSAPSGVAIGFITADSSTQITLVADTAVDAGVGLNVTPYWFDETGGASGATDSSSWQSSTSYVDTGLSPNTQYTYRVKARDSLSNESSYSTATSTYTLANIPSSLTLSGAAGQAVSASWSANSNPSGTEYYIENISASTNSGWTSATSWNSSGLSCATSYSFRLKARNSDGVETSYTSTSSVVTDSCSGAGVALPDFSEFVFVDDEVDQPEDTSNMEDSDEPEVDHDGPDSEEIDNEENYFLIKYHDDPKVYFLQNNIKQWIVDEATFLSFGYSWEDIKLLSNDEQYDDGENIALEIAQEAEYYNFISYMYIGFVGQEVSDLQILLTRLGYFNYPEITGYYGPITAEAVRNFQLDNGIDPLAVVGPKTRAKLNEFLKID